MAHNKFNMNVNEVQIKIKRRMGEKKRKEKPHAASWVDLKYVQFSASSTNQNAPETASRSPFSKQITEGECMQLDTELTFTGVILSRLELSKATLC